MISRFRKVSMKKIAIAIVCLTSAAWLPAGDLQVGRAAVKITPPNGMIMRGDFVLKPGSIHDELYSKALVVEKDGAKAALVVCDLIGVSRSIVEQARQLIQKDSGIPGERVMISGTHIHTGPLLAGRSRPAGGSTAPAVVDYTASLPGKIAESVRLAASRLAPARVSAGIGREPFTPANPCDPALRDHETVRSTVSTAGITVCRHDFRSRRRLPFAARIIVHHSRAFHVMLILAPVLRVIADVLPYRLQRSRAGDDAVVKSRLPFKSRCTHHCVTPALKQRMT